MTAHRPKLINRADLPPDCREAAAILNQDCFCRTVDHAALQRAFEWEGFSYQELLASRPHLFADTRVYVAQTHLDFMAGLIKAIGRVVALPAWQKRVLAYAPENARCFEPKAAGAFLGFDFHLGDDGPRLIEINTNAGGGMLVARLLGAQQACCPSFDAACATRHGVEESFAAMFFEEWRLERGNTPLNCIAIVDESPEEQFLSPEFELFRQLFEAHGIATRVLSPSELEFDGQFLRHDGQVIDLVYNRLTDFALEEPGNAALQAAYLAGAVVLTPHPRAHALYADKRNLVALSDDAWLAAIGVSAADRQLIKLGVPATSEVTPENAVSFWATRKQWFFKPCAGYGSKGAYRGDKVTKRVFDEIAQGGFIAQALVPPSERHLLVDGVEHRLKLDLRNYVYRDAVQLVSARLYQGQTTNFRTRGGGFAAVFPVGCR
ncbi:hypothetical protein [Propionivibrio limicola]|uniref:hypothetical protein n=1 Tax=Propionivibrio limicola TaxID=167645 RepID=UPI001290ED00|nr:hypothetical protein [Propionivibrio limicola]